MDLSTLSMILVFTFGYFFIAFEHLFHMNKTMSALLMGVVLWVLQFSRKGIDFGQNLTHLSSHLANVSEIILFLLGALLIVEIIQAHGGFDIILQMIRIRSKRKLFWAVGFLTFFFSSVLDNLTTTVIMISIMQKLLNNTEDKLVFGGGIVIAANAGGVWTPIGDVTTTMLWIGGRISSGEIITHLFLPSIVCLIVSFLCLTPMLQGTIAHTISQHRSPTKKSLRVAILVIGGCLLLFVPVFKHFTGLPPFMGMVFGASVLWLITDMLLRGDKEREPLKGANLLRNVDLSGPLFFLGILLSINALETGGILEKFSAYINQNVSNTSAIATLIGLSSSVIDNIPLVAASMGMYSLAEFPLDCCFWQLIAYCAGTGGSALIIGSAAGIVFMNMEKVSFFDYIKKISLPALLGYFAGILAYLYFS